LTALVHTVITVHKIRGSCRTYS